MVQPLEVVGLAAMTSFYLRHEHRVNFRYNKLREIASICLSVDRRVQQNVAPACWDCAPLAVIIHRSALGAGKQLEDEVSVVEGFA